MNYPEQLKQMSNEELISEFKSCFRNDDLEPIINIESELISRMGATNGVLKQQYQKGWESRGEEAMRRVKTRPIKNKPEVNKFAESFMGLVNEYYDDYYTPKTESAGYIREIILIAIKALNQK